ncbi:MAG: hypothetical protein RJA25_1569 [Bacteroidota bacterium]|jgi:polyhydroxyalkanoate synthesis regulator phasin
MSALVKKAIYMSIGVASVTNEKFKELMEDLIQNDQFTEDEGKRLVDDFFIKLREQYDTINTSFQVRIDEALSKFGIPSVHTIKEEVENYVNEVKENPIAILRLPSRK